MLKRSKGFTLIELLIVVAIIGILAALLIPNALSAIQKAKQKGTMKDMNSIATGITDYITDKGKAPNFSGGEVSAADTQLISPFYIKVFPRNDQWGNPFTCFSGADAQVYGCAYAGGEDFGLDEYVVGSGGRDGSFDGPAFDPQAPSDGLYVMNTMADFNNDLVVWSGAWVVGPRTGSSS